MSRSLGIVRFGELAPDQPDLGNRGSEDVRNVIPTANGFDSFNGLIPYTTNGLDSRALGAYSAKDRDGNTVTVAGDVGKLYLLVSGAWADASRVAGYDSRTTRWEFLQSGQSIIANNFWDPPQVLQFGGGQFADLITSSLVIRGHTAGLSRDYLMLGNTDGTGAEEHMPSRVWWSGYRNSSSFGEGQITGSDFQDLEDEGGSIQRIIGGTEVVILKEESLWLATFSQAATFRFDQIEEKVGTRSPNSVISVQGSVYFLALDGFRRFQGGRTAPIGTERVNRRFQKDMDWSFADRVSAGIMRNRNVIVWAYPGSGSTNGTCNRLLIYNYVANRWAFGDDSIELLVEAATEPTSLDDFDAIYPSIDDIPGSLDDDVWTGGTIDLAALIGKTNRLGFFNGDPRVRTLETGERRFGDRRMLLQAVRGLVQGTDIKMQVGYRNFQSDSVTWTPEIEPNGFGYHTFRIDSRYFRFRVTAGGEFEDAIGVEPMGEPSGDR